MLSGEEAFTLHDTYGFPVEVTQEIAEGRGVKVDMEAFEAAMEAQRERAAPPARRTPRRPGPPTAASTAIF